MQCNDRRGSILVSRDTAICVRETIWHFAGALFVCPDRAAQWAAKGRNELQRNCRLARATGRAAARGSLNVHAVREHKNGAQGQQEAHSENDICSAYCLALIGLPIFI